MKYNFEHTSNIIWIRVKDLTFWIYDKRFYLFRSKDGIAFSVNHLDKRKAEVLKFVLKNYDDIVKQLQSQIVKDML